MIKAIVCMGANSSIGKNGTMPWGDKPLDGKHFRTLTEGHTVVMGRKTAEGMGYTPLPKRYNIILSRTAITAEGMAWYSTIEEVKELPGDVWIIGGSEVYRAFLPHIEELYVTTVGEVFEADTFFPNPFDYGEWKHEVLRTEVKDDYVLNFQKLTRKRSTL